MVAALLIGQTPIYGVSAAWVENAPARFRVWLKQVDPQYKSWRSDEERPWIAVVVRGVDAPGGALIVQHGPTKRPAMKAMTMRLPVTNSAQILTLRRGDRVQIQAADIEGLIKIVNVRSPQ